jgi:hypothetical protein
MPTKSQLPIGRGDRDPASRARRTRRIRVFESLEPRQLMAVCPLPGDANQNGEFNESDLVLVFQAGKYETAQPATWQEGDWNHDGLFNSGDLVAALQTGRYRLPAEDCGPAQGVSVWLRPQGIFDPLIGQVAAAVLVPDGWSMQGVIQYGSIPALTLTGAFLVRSPDGTTGVEAIAAEPGRTWTDGPFPPPEGQLDFRGLLLERPKDGFQYLNTYVFPVLQQQHPDYQVVEIRREPLLIEAMIRRFDVIRPFLIAAGGDVGFDAVSVRARYSVNGIAVEEIIHAQFQYTINQVGILVGTDWGMTAFERVFAPVGQLENQLPVLKTIARSSIPNFNWFVTLQNHRATLLGIIANAQQEWNNYIQQQNALMDSRLRIYDQFDYYIRGTRIAEDPFTGRRAEVPDNSNVWFGQDGSLQINSDPTFDPNRFGGTWLRAPQ